MSRQIRTAGCLALPSLLAASTPAVRDDPVAKIDAFIAAEMRRSHVPGLALGGSTIGGLCVVMMNDTFGERGPQALLDDPAKIPVIGK